MNEFQNIFMITGGLSCMLLIVGLIMPDWTLWWKDVQNRRMVIKFYGTATMVSILLYSLVRLTSI